MIHIGFTGTQFGMTDRQKQTLRLLFRAFAFADVTVLHHGDCVGADAEAHNAATQVLHKIVVHPPSNPKKRAYVHSSPETKVLDEKPYAERNRTIVDMCDMLIAAPRKRTEEVRSGTWMTVRYATRHHKKTIILDP